MLRQMAAMRPQEYAPTCYGPDGRLLANDDDLKVFERSVLQVVTGVDPAEVKRIERLLAEAEKEDKHDGQV
jgi:hypothetical protein